MKGGRTSKGPGDIYRSRTLQQTPTWTKNTQRGWLCVTRKHGPEHSAGAHSRRHWLPSLLSKPLTIPSASHHVSLPPQPPRGALKVPSHEPHRLRPPRVQRTTLYSAKARKGFLSRFQSLPAWRKGIWYLAKHSVMKISLLKHMPLPLILPNHL